MATRTHLTVDRIRKLSAPDGKLPSYVFDDDPKRLCVRVTPAGVKSYVFASKLQGVPMRITIGSTDVWALEKAREEAKRLQAMVDQGIDPRETAREKAAEKARAKAAEEKARLEDVQRNMYTLKALCAAYVDHLKARGKHKSASDAKSAFNVHVAEAWPDISALPAQAVTSKQIAAIVRKVRETGKERTAGILRSYLASAYNAARRAPFDSAMSSALVLFDITVNPAEIVPTIPVRRGNRTLSADELKVYVDKLGDSQVDQTLLVDLYAAGQRMAQIVRAKVCDFNADNGSLMLLDPKGKRATAREHLLPLGPKAIAIIEALIAQRDRPDARLFGTTARDAGNRVAELSTELGGEPFDLKDLRRTCETMLVGMGVTKDIRAQLLSHGISGVQSAHYDRYEYFAEKRNTLIAWERRLDEITKGIKVSNVIAFAPTAA